jgi:hypothetical protein
VVVILGFFVRRLLVLLTTTGVAEHPPKVVAVDGSTVGTRVPWALFLQELLELLLRCRLLAPRRMIHSHDDIIWLSFQGWTQKVPLAFVVAVVVWAPQVAILTPQEPLPHLLLLFGPIVHHIMKARNGLRPILPKISVDVWVSDAVVEAVDDVILRNVRDGGADVEKATCVGPQELVTFLFTLGKIMTSTCTSDRSLEVIDEDLLEALPGVDGVAAEALQLGERRRVQSHQKVDDFGDVRAPCNLNGRGVTTEPLVRGLLAIVLGDADRLEALRVLIAAELRRESWKTITAISPFSLDFFTYHAPGGDHCPRIAAIINVLAQVLNLSKLCVPVPSSS